MSKAWKPPSSRPILIYFEFRSKPSLITVISMDPRPTNYLRQNIVFSYPEMIRVSFSLLFSLSVFCYFTLLLMFIKIILFLLLFYLFIFMKIIVIFSCYGMFRNVQACSGMFHVPGFIDAPLLRAQNRDKTLKKKKTQTHTHEHLLPGPHVLSVTNWKHVLSVFIRRKGENKDNCAKLKYSKKTAFVL